MNHWRLLSASRCDFASEQHQGAQSGPSSPAVLVVIELALMGAMYSDRRKNVVIMAVSLVTLAMFWICIRQQTAITERQFLRSMIPHHAGAILMCEEAPLRDPQIKERCAEIVASQRSEIEQMKGQTG